MRLTKIEIQGYARFEAPSELRIASKVTAVVGPNEAGKSSLLKAIHHLSTEDDISRGEIHGRRTENGDALQISATFEIERNDLERAGISTAFERGEKVALTVQKGVHGFNFHLSPQLHRDLTKRKRLQSRLGTGAARRRFAEAEGLVPTSAWPDSLDRPGQIVQRHADVVEMLENADEDMNEFDIKTLDLLEEILEAEEFPGDAWFAKTRELLDELRGIELEYSPQERATEALADLVPKFILFTAGEHELRDEYFWDDFSSAPEELQDLLHVSKVDFDDFRAIAKDPSRTDELATVEMNANRELESAFGDWSQSELTVLLRADSEFLRIFVTEPVVGRATPVSERSAGLRSFLAMSSFASRHANGRDAILLIDEAEEHLHYDAQADLIAIFEAQPFLSNVIYTTHSVGCLPDDLGMGIRAVTRHPRSESSSIENRFWATGHGMTPLMVALGATAVAFTPARAALVGEGATEAVLLPSLFRAVLGPGGLGIQVAPGLSGVPDELADHLEMDAGIVLYLVDDDDGGRNHSQKIARAAHNAGRVFVLGNGKHPGLCVEDFVARKVLTNAVNQVLGDSRPDTAARLGPDELPAVARGSFIDSWCDKHRIDRISKPHIAHEAVWSTYQDDPARLLEPARKKILVDLAKAISDKIPGKNMVP